jgi:hypothetical protein
MGPFTMEASRPSSVGIDRTGKFGESVEEFLESVPGAGDLFAWFGYWPNFHDAEIISLALNRSGASTLRIHTWETTSRVDERGYYVLDKHVHVAFQMEDIRSLSLSDFNQQNVIFGLSLRHTEDGFEICLDPCYGLSGSILAQKLSIQIEPMPPGAS